MKNKLVEDIKNNEELQTLFKMVIDIPNNYELGKQVRSWVWDIQDKVNEEWK